MTTSELRADDVDRLVRVIEDARDDDPGEALPWALLEGLQRLVPCDVEVNYQHHVPRARHCLLIQGVEPGDVHLGLERPEPSPPEEPFWPVWWESMCSWPQLTGDLRSVIHTCDFYATDRDWRAGPLAEVMDPVRWTMIISLPAAPGEVRRVAFMRGSGPAFTERDRQLASLLRPQVQEIWADAERRRASVPRLTAREWEVLSLAATGVPYAVIARQLFISVGTVRKHMEHVRERLGVHSVAAAAAIALPHAPPDVRSTAAAPGPAPSGRGGAR
ncbi:helix-turn-helix transcriptional regulator [Modestobacter sp. URMC 112]